MAQAPDSLNRPSAVSTLSHTAINFAAGAGLAVVTTILLSRVLPASITRFGAQITDFCKQRAWLNTALTSLKARVSVEGIVGIAPKVGLTAGVLAFLSLQHNYYTSTTDAHAATYVKVKADLEKEKAALSTQVTTLEGDNKKLSKGIRKAHRALDTVGGQLNWQERSVLLSEYTNLQKLEFKEGEEAKIVRDGHEVVVTQEQVQMRIAELNELLNKGDAKALGELVGELTQARAANLQLQEQIAALQGQLLLPSAGASAPQESVLGPEASPSHSNDVPNGSSSSPVSAKGSNEFTASDAKSTKIDEDDVEPQAVQPGVDLGVTIDT